MGVKDFSMFIVIKCKEYYKDKLILMSVESRKIEVKAKKKHEFLSLNFVSCSATGSLYI